MTNPDTASRCGICNSDTPCPHCGCNALGNCTRHAPKTTTELANKITIDLNNPDVLSINGQKFGYYIAAEELDVKVNHAGLGTVRLTLIAENVEVIPKIDEQPPNG